VSTFSIKLFHYITSFQRLVVQNFKQNADELDMLKDFVSLVSKKTALDKALLKECGRTSNQIALGSEGYLRGLLRRK